MYRRCSLMLLNGADLRPDDLASSVTVFAPVVDALCRPALPTPFVRQHSVLNVGVSETDAGPARVLESSRSAATISLGSMESLGHVKVYMCTCQAI